MNTPPTIHRLIATSGSDLPLTDVQKETQRLLDNALAPTTGAATATHPRLRRALERTAHRPAATAGGSRTRARFRARTTGGSVAGS